MAGFRSTATTSARRWKTYASGSLPVVFADGERPKAIFLNDVGNVTLLGEDGVSGTFTPAVGVPIQLRPKSIVSTSAAAVIALFD